MWKFQGKKIASTGVAIFGLFFIFSTGYNFLRASDTLIENTKTYEISFTITDEYAFIVEQYPVNKEVNSRLFISAESFNVPLPYLDFVMPENIAYFKSTVAPTIYSDEENKALMRRLLRTWTLLAEQDSVPYWITSGTLLGWYWNYEFLPWEKSLTIALPSNILFHLERIQSANLYDERYKFEINPNYLQRIIQTGNAVDARLTDLESGRFIDFMGISNEGIGENTILADKSGLKFSHSLIFPLRRVLIENILVWIPNKVEKYLTSEFSNEDLNSIGQKGFVFSFKKRKWIKLDSCEYLQKLYLNPSRDEKAFPKYAWHLQVMTNLDSKIYPACSIKKTEQDGKVSYLNGVWEAKD